MADSTLLTPAEARERLLAHGINMRVWARDHGFSYDNTVNVLNGRTKNTWGECHRIAVALGIKANPESSSQSLLSQGVASTPHKKAAS